MKFPVLFLVGPTAIGKSSLAIELAMKYDAEIISADSRQIYINMVIGTAQPNNSEMKGISHHFVSELKPDEPFSAGEFQKQANDRIKNIILKGKNVIVAGGSGLYISALRDGMADIPKSDEIRQQLLDRLETEGNEKLFTELEQIDPDASKTMDSTKSQRMIRALEVYYFTGKPISEWHKNQTYQFNYPNLTIGLFAEREILYDRINRRVDMMIDAGLVDEVNELLSLGYDRTCNALKTVGYDEIFDYFEGKYSLNEAIEKIKQHTRNYAKRQLTWFRNDTRIQWLDISDMKFEEKSETLWKRSR